MEIQNKFIDGDELDINEKKNIHNFKYKNASLAVFQFCLHG